MSVVYRPPEKHTCEPGLSPDNQHGAFARATDYPEGTVWQCHCGATWVSKGEVGLIGNMYSLETAWRRERPRERRRRERRQA